MNIAVKNGLIYGLVSIVIALATYLINPALRFNMWLNLAVGLAVSLFFMIKACREEKEVNEGILTYGETVKTTFIVIVIGLLLSVTFDFILKTVIDPSLVEQELEYGIKMGQDMAKKFGADEEAIDRIREEAEAQNTTPTIGNTFLGFIFACLFGLVYCLIVSAFLKKNPTIA